MYRATSNDIVIALSKRKILLLLAGSVAFVATGIVLWTIADTQNRYNALFVKAVALACVTFFGMCGLYACLKLFDSKPGLIIDAEGLVDNSSAVAAGRIPWSEVVGLSVTKIARSSFVTVQVPDPYKYVERAGALQRIASTANTKLVGSPINISSLALKIPFDELVQILRESHERYTRKTER